MVPAIAGRIPLVRRPKAPALPLGERIAHLTGLAVAPAGANHHDLVARASGVLNYAALVASDVGIPDLAADLSWRQHQVFADAGHLAGDIAVMSLMPLINFSRLLTREGDGQAAYEVLIRLYRAAQKRGTTEIHGHTIDLSALTSTEEDHRKICQELWVTLLVDGARALARIGRWAEAAQAMTKHRAIGNRLLDGRQIMIMSLMERGLGKQARTAIESATPTEPWENAVAALLRIHCGPAESRLPEQELDHALREAVTATAEPAPSVALFQTRVALTAFDLVHNAADSRTTHLLDNVAQAAALDAYAAREVLNHPAGSHLTRQQRQRLEASVCAAGLRTGRLPSEHAHSLKEAVDQAERALRSLLDTPGPRLD
ncbi:hypothetical protein [Streptomyces sp. NPDC005012]|uniref:hypothetical protein n=1 Tax=Streptomyces sp. NPDC005012 TaxID=3154558 RepID=UPI0033A4D85C